MARIVVWLSCLITLLCYMADAAVVEHTFHVRNVRVRKLCRNTVITTVNGRLPGPTIEAHEGDTVIVQVINESPHNITIHWHGVFQLLTAWSDGASYITQCPILPGNRYTYKFNIIGQEGTLWWHAHFSFLRATVYGALLVRPRPGSETFQFPKPYKEAILLLGEWWNSNMVDVEKASFQAGGIVPASNAFTVNGRMGDLYRCSKKHTYKLEVERGQTYMLRIINAALNGQLFFKIAGHMLTVIAADASYTTPYASDVVVLAPGQTIDALMVANAPPGRYYIAAREYISSPGSPTPIDKTATTGIIQYKSIMPSFATPLMPILPAFSDTQTAHRFYSGLTAFVSKGMQRVPLMVDEHMFVTVGLGVVPCLPDQTKCNTFAIAGSVNNISFQFPTKMSLLEAHFKGVKGIYTSDFPDFPPRVFDYSRPPSSMNPPMTKKGTSLKRLKYNATVQVVLQNTALIGPDNHPMHLHGFDFFVLAQGFGNYNGAIAEKSFNLLNPQIRNTIAVPVGGWAVIRFTANNPGVWMMHCHLDLHLPLGLAMAFEVENGPTPCATLSPPPPDFPRC